MELLAQVILAIALVVLMIGFRMFASQAVFRFRMNNGFRSHECDGTCHGHVARQTAETEQEHRI
jgi:hypothetical protein